MRVALTLLLVLVGGATWADDPNPPGDLSLTVFVSPSDEFIEEWTSTPAEHAPRIKRIKEAKVNQLVHIGFVTTGHTAGEEGKVVLDVDVRVMYPSGEVLFQQDRFARYEGKPKGPGFLLADPVMQLMIESTDPTGSYRIQGVVHDHATGKSARGEVHLSIVP